MDSVIEGLEYGTSTNAVSEHLGGYPCRRSQHFAPSHHLYFFRNVGLDLILPSIMDEPYADLRLTDFGY